MTSGTNLPDIGPDKHEKLIKWARALAGAVPNAGSLLAESVDEIFPSRRIERIEKYLKYLKKALEGIGVDNFEDIIADEGNLDVIEDIVDRFRKSAADVVIKRLAALSAHSFAVVDKEKLRARRLISIVSQLDEEEFSTLQEMERSPYLENHSTDDDGRSFEGAMVAKLISLSLVRRRIRTIDECVTDRLQRDVWIKLPDFNSNGTLVSDVDITPLGIELLRMVESDVG